MTDPPNPVVEMVEKATKPTVEVADARPPEYSDEALAQRFARMHGKTLRYVAAWAHWHAWAGARWALDSTLDAFDRARAICRAAASEADKPHVKTALASAKTAAAIERLAKADRRIAATVEQWDMDPDTFNTLILPPANLVETEAAQRLSVGQRGGDDGGAIGDTET